MHSFLKIAALAAGVAYLTCGSSAHFAAAQTQTTVTHTQVTTDNNNNSAEATAMRASDLRSLAVYGTGNEKLGSIEDFVLDPASGQIRYAVLSFGGILGMGDKYFAIPWSDVKVFTKGVTSAGTQREVYCTVDVSKESLKNAPGFDKAHWPNFADKTFVADIERFYGSNRTAAKIHGDNR